MTYLRHSEVTSLRLIWAVLRIGFGTQTLSLIWITLKRLA